MFCWIETGHQTAWTDMDTVVWMKCNNASLNKPPSTLINHNLSNLVTLQLCNLLNNGTMCEKLLCRFFVHSLEQIPSCDLARGLLALVFLSLKPTFKNYNPALLGHLP